MCDFLSVVIRRDGKIFHLPTNSHSGIVDHYGLTENDTMAEMRNLPRFYEFEWDGEDDTARTAKGYLRGPNPPAIVVKAAATLAANLRRALNEPGWGCLDDGFFAAPEWADVRWKALCNPKCPPDVADRIAETPLHANGETISSLRPTVTAIGGSFRVAAGYKITAPVLAKAGYVCLDQGASLDAPVLAEVVGDVILAQGASLDAPVLAEVDGYMRLDQGASLDVPMLSRVGRVYVSKHVNVILPSLTSVLDVVMEAHATLGVPLLDKADALTMREAATLNAPMLTNIECMNLDCGVTLNAPLLKDVPENSSGKGACCKFRDPA